VPGLPDGATQGDTFEELLTNIHEAAGACLAVELK
jgi:predicted RNase H-like HicB family nuclease